jgi:hypothetical protein
MSRQRVHQLAWGATWTLPVWIVALVALAVHP